MGSEAERRRFICRTSGMLLIGREGVAKRRKEGKALKGNGVSELANEVSGEGRTGARVARI